MRRIASGWVVAALVVGLVAGAAGAQLAGQLLKLGGMVYVADHYGPTIDKGLNGLLGGANLKSTAATKVTPVLSVGKGGFIGVVQVTGPQKLVDEVKAVAQLETEIRLPLLGRVRGRVLVPVDGRNPGSLRRVSGVGVSGLLDVKL